MLVSVQADMASTATRTSSPPGPARLTGDRRAIQAVPGVGLKTAERVILELRDRIDDMDLAAGVPAAAATAQAHGRDDHLVGDAISALENLGYRPQQAREAVRAFLDDMTDDERQMVGLEAILRGALGRLNR